MNTTHITHSLIGIVCIASLAHAHDGRRFEIQVIDDQLWAQGYLSGDTSDDGGGLVRPYYNAIHGHWHNNDFAPVAAADLPGFDLPATSSLAGHDLTLTFTGASKWIAPPAMPAPDTIVDLVALDAGEEIIIEFGGQSIAASTGGSLTLFDTVSPAGHLDIDFDYSINSQPAGVLYVLQFVLGTGNTDIASSETISIILSPDGTGPVERLHHASLFLESQLGVPVPAPGTLALLGMGGVMTTRRRR